MIANQLDLMAIGQKMLALACILFFILIFSLAVRSNRKLLKYFIGFAMLVHVVYMTWRLLFTIPRLNAISFIFGMLLFLAEFFALIQSTTHRLLFLKDYKQDERTLGEFKNLPTVDILIATYNEPVEILRNTIAAAVNQKYPKDKFNVFVCDDGKREEVRQLAEEYGAIWAIREKHVHAKAGNLNNCLKNYAKGDLFAVFDADMIPKSTFLEKTVGYFIDPEMALVQAPQVFYNPDPFQNNLQLYDAIPNEQDFFMREVLTRRGMFNAVLNVGSNAIFRRSAIEAIGMIPVGTITEDMATSMLLQAKGFKTLFVNETLAMGLSPDSFSDYVVQRDRWCRGNIQVFKKWNPLTLPGLSLMQRLIYFDGVLYWFFGLQKIIYFIGPILFLLTGIPIFYADIFTMLLFFVPTYYISSLIFTLFNHKNRTYVWAHIYESALAPYLLLSALGELFFTKKVGFSVTPKGNARDKTRFNLQVAAPHLFFFVISLIALGFGIHKMLTDVNYMVPVYMVNLFWLLYNLLGIMAAILVCFEKQRFRSAERFIVRGQLQLVLDKKKTIPVELIDISMNSCAVKPLVPIEEPDRYISSDIILIEKKSHLKLSGEFYRSRAWGNRIIIKFKQLSNEQNTRLLNFIFDCQESGYGHFTEESINIVKDLKIILNRWWNTLIQKK
jgi:cellulose synthase (UDP-forming)